MRFRRLTFTAFVAAGALVTSMASADAEPAAPPSNNGTGQAAPSSVRLDSKIVDGHVVATLTDGRFTQEVQKTADDSDVGYIAVRNSDGQVLEQLPSTFTLDGKSFPITTRISADGRALELKPEITKESTSGLQPVASALENQLAANDALNVASAALSIGSIVGTLIGSIIGGGVGLAMAGASCVVIAVGCVLAVIPMLTLGATVGGILGLNVAGAGALVAAGWTYVQTMMAEPGQSVYASQIPGLNQQPQSAPAGE